MIRCPDQQGELSRHDYETVCVTPRLDIIPFNGIGFNIKERWSAWGIVLLHAFFHLSDVRGALQWSYWSYGIKPDEITGVQMLENLDKHYTRVYNEPTEGWFSIDNNYKVQTVKRAYKAIVNDKGVFVADNDP